jgi:hypothetical protein
VDQHVLARQSPAALEQSPIRRSPRDSHPRALLKRRAIRKRMQVIRVANRQLGIRPGHRLIGVHAIPNLEMFHALADRFNHAGRIVPRRIRKILRPVPPGSDIRLHRIHAGSLHRHANLPRPNDRLRHVLGHQHLRLTKGMNANCLHGDAP